MARSISKSIRFEIFKRDDFICQYCGAHPPAVILEVDHIHPVSKGGQNEPENLITACINCNRGKAARLLNVAPQSLSEKARLTQEREAQIKGYSDVMIERRQRIEDDAWLVVDVYDSFGREKGISSRLFGSIKMFVEKMGVAETLEAMDLAVAKKHRGTSVCFRYFCGICWNKMKALQNG